MSTLDKIIAALAAIGIFAAIHAIDVRNFVAQGKAQEDAHVATASRAAGEAAAKVTGQISQRLDDAEQTHAQELADIKSAVAAAAAGLQRSANTPAALPNHPAAPIEHPAAPPSGPGCAGVLPSPSDSLQSELDAARREDILGADYRLLYDAWPSAPTNLPPPQ